MAPSNDQLLHKSRHVNPFKLRLHVYQGCVASPWSASHALHEDKLFMLGFTCVLSNLCRTYIMFYKLYLHSCSHAARKDACMLEMGVVTIFRDSVRVIAIETWAKQRTDDDFFHDHHHQIIMSGPQLSEQYWTIFCLLSQYTV